MMAFVVAMANDQVIGIANRMPWNLPNDLKHFRQLTWGHPVVMGRKTFQSIGKPLKGRENIVITRDAAFEAEGVTVIHDFQEVKRRAATETIFIIGGSEIYQQLLFDAEKMYITRIQFDFEGDAYFPAFDASAWRLVRSVEGQVDDLNNYPHAFEEWTRVKEERILDDRIVD